eukprot:1005079-Pyramimonas_sp.AAC.1
MRLCDCATVQPGRERAGAGLASVLQTAGAALRGGPDRALHRLPRRHGARCKRNRKATSAARALVFGVTQA